MKQFSYSSCERTDTAENYYYFAWVLCAIFAVCLSEYSREVQSECKLCNHTCMLLNNETKVYDANVVS